MVDQDTHGIFEDIGLLLDQGAQTMRINLESEVMVSAPPKPNKRAKNTQQMLLADPKTTPHPKTPGKRRKTATVRQNRPRFLTAREWGERGVNVQHDTGDFPRAERETTVAFLSDQRTAEVVTAEKSWMRRLESDGAIPETIYSFNKSDGESRFYIIPRSWVKRPYKSKRSD